jgi:DNA invertase Pin-like site-specific DNA recombinase
MTDMAKKSGKKQTAVAVIYARYSSHSQKDASIEQQVAECQAYAERFGLTVSEIYDDRAMSGKSDKRPNFQRMMKDAEKGKFSYVLAWKSNRIGRNMLQAMVNEARLSDLGIRCLYTEEDFDDTAAGRFALRSMMNVNQFYSENMAEDIRRGLRDNAQQCKATGTVPFGYAKDSELNIVLDELRAPIVREIFERVANGEQYASIADDLNERGIRTGTGKTWGKGSFHRLLHNERYRGIYIYSDIRIESGIPRIVPDDLYFRVQEAVKVKKNPEGKGMRTYGSYLLTGKLFCGKCKSPMVGTSGTGKSGALHYYYVCQKRRKEHTCTKKPLVRDKIEYAVAKAVRQFVLTDSAIDDLADLAVAAAKRKAESSELGLHEIELAEVDKSIRGLMSAIENGLYTDSMKSRMMDLESKKKELQQRITIEKSEIIDIPKELIVAGLKMMKDGDVKDKKYQRQLIETFVKAVYVYDDELFIGFTVTGDHSSINIPLDSGIVDDAEGIAQGSYESPCAPPKKERPTRGTLRKEGVPRRLCILKIF